ncbi:MAG: phosphoribosyltransferase family protein [bacterium]|nr:phosphoribosyltransferase family protein [bacterium]
MIFKDREEAGQRLLPRLADLEDEANTIIVGLARGGVIVAKEVAQGLDLPLHVIIAQKIGAPGNPELAIGAIAESSRILDEKIIKEYKISRDYINVETAKLRQEITRRVKLYRKGESFLNLGGKTVVLVDDGIATGATMNSAINYAKTAGAREVIVAVPVASDESLQKIEKEIDRVVCLERVGPYFFAVGEHYEHFPQVSDEEVISALKSVSAKD